MNVTLEQARNIYPHLSVWDRPEVETAMATEIRVGIAHIEHRNGNLFWVPALGPECELDRLGYSSESGLHRITYAWDGWDDDGSPENFDTSAVQSLRKHLQSIIDDVAMAMPSHRAWIEQHLSDLGRKPEEFTNFSEYQYFKRVEHKLDRARALLAGIAGNNLVALALMVGEMHSLAYTGWGKPIVARLDLDEHDLSRRFPVEPYDRD